LQYQEPAIKPFPLEMRTALFWVITQRVMLISSRRFRKTYRVNPEDGNR